MNLTPDSNGIVYQNQYYAITIVEDVDSPVESDGGMYERYYAATNLFTGVVELKHPSMPVILHNVERWSLDMESESFLWAREHSDDADDELDDGFIEDPITPAH